MKKSWYDQLSNPEDKSGRISKLLVGLTIILTLFGSYIGWRVWNEIGQMTEAKNDLVPWNLSQLEVEYLEFASSLHHYSDVLGQADSEQIQKLLAEATTRFDIFYSRVATVSESDIYSLVRNAPESADNFRALRTYTNDTAGYIDNLENEIQDSVDLLIARTYEIQSTVRKVSLVGVNLHAIQSEEVRQGVFSTLSQYMFSISGLFLALALIASLLWTTARALRQQTVETLANAARLKAVFDASPYPILVIGQDERILDVNKAAETAFGFALEEFTDLSLPDMFEPEASDGEFNYSSSRSEDETTLGKETVRQRLLAKRRNGTTFHSISLRSHAIERQGSVEIMVVRDISETLKYEKQILESRDQARAGERAKERLLAVISHEMRTPLHAILGAIEILGRTSLTTRQKELSDISEQSAKNLLTQVKNLLRVAKETSDEPISVAKDFHLGWLLKSILESNKILAAKNRNSLEVQGLSGEHEFVRGDPEALRQILVNLIGNAIKFTKDGVVTLSVRKDDTTGLYRFVICDTGDGIAPEHRGEIFKDFYSVESSGQIMPAGTGLGLGIVRRLVEAMHGTVTFESELGKGSCFEVSVPLEDAVELPVKTEEALTDFELVANFVQENNLKKIMVAEDDDFSRRLLTDGLQSLGFEVEIATNGSDAVRFAATRKFDCIILDINMPKFDGAKAAAAIRFQAGPSSSAPILALTAHVFPEEMEEISRAGFTKILSKPLSMKQLLAELEELASPTRSRLASDVSALIDEAIFQEVIEIYGSGETKKILDQYYEECIQRLDALTLPGEESERLEHYLRELHTLRGSSALLGARLCAEKLLELESLARAGRYSASFDGLPDLRSTLEMTFEGLTRILGFSAELDEDAL